MPTTYWENKGKFQQLYERLFMVLIPKEGEASTEHGEMLRLASMFYRDFHKKNTNAVTANYGFVLGQLVKKAENPQMNDLYDKIYLQVATADEYEVFLDWIILYVATQDAGGAIGDTPGMILMTITDSDLQALAMVQLGRQLTAEEIVAIAPDLEAATRLFVVDSIKAKIEEMGLQ